MNFHECLNNIEISQAYLKKHTFVLTKPKLTCDNLYIQRMHLAFIPICMGRCLILL